ncbi:uncharacterized protein LOC111125133 [Crassostrea virginica]
MPSGECHEAGKRFLKKKSKPLKPDLIHLGTLEEQGEEDKMNFLLNNTREIVKVCLTGLGDVQGKEDIAVLDRENKFLLTPEREAKEATFDAELASRRENGANTPKKSLADISLENLHEDPPLCKLSEESKSSEKDPTHHGNDKNKKDVEGRMKGLYPSLGHHPHRVIYVREADHKIDTLYMAPTLIVRSHREEGHLKEYNNLCATYNWRRDVPVSVSDSGNSETFDFRVDPHPQRTGHSSIRSNLSLVSNKSGDSRAEWTGYNRITACDSSSSDGSQSLDSKYVIIQGEINRLTPIKNKSKKGKTKQVIKKSCSVAQEDRAVQEEADPTPANQSRILSAPHQ